MAESILDFVNQTREQMQAEVDKAKAEAEEKQRRIQEEINRQICEARTRLTQVQEIYDQLVQEAGYALGIIKGIRTAMNALLNTVSAATEQTNIGYAQFAQAATSALNRCANIQSTLEAVLPTESYGSVSVVTISGEINTQDRVRVAPEIAGAVETIRDANAFVIDLSRQLTPMMETTGSSSVDLDTATVQMSEMAIKVEQLGTMLFRNAQDLKAIYDGYHTVQEEAIRKASRIPY